MPFPVRRGGLSHRTVFVGLAASLAVGILIGWVFYLRLVHFERVAVQYIPPELTAAVRLDVEQVILFEPVRRHLLPLLDELPKGAPDPARRRRLEQRSGLKLAVDLRELVFAWNADGKWLLVVSGKFGGAGAARELAREYGQAIGEAAEEFRPQGTSEGFRWSSGLTLAQTPDGAFLLGQADTVAKGARGSGSMLPGEGPGSMSISGREWEQLVSWMAARDWPDRETARTLSTLQGLRGRLEIGSSVVLRLALSPASDTSPESARVLEALRRVANANRLPQLPKAEVSMERQGTSAPYGTEVRVNWPREAMLAYSEAVRDGVLAALGRPAGSE